MTYDELLTNIETISTSIKQDEERLINIINAINSGDVNLDINDKLLDNLNKISFEDKDTESLRDYLGLILSNFESQKLNNSKSIIEEFIKILSHNLRTLDSIQLFVNRIKTESNVEETITMDTVEKPDKKRIDLTSFQPNTALSNILFYGAILFIIIFSGYEIDRKTTKDTLNSVNNITHPKRVTGVTNANQHNK